MKVAIFGASGLVGRELRRLFDSKGIPWVGTYNTSAFPTGIYMKKTDTSSLNDFVNAHQVTHCINCIAERNVDLCEKQWELTYETNCAFAARLATVCMKNNIYFLHVSTDYVFDGSQAPYSPLSTCHPIQAYGKSKRLAEQAIEDVNTSCCIVRVPVLYTDNYKNLLETSVTMIGKKVMDSTTVVQEDNYLIRRPVFVEDFALFLLSCLHEKKVALFHFYNPNDRVTKYQMAKLIGNYLQKDISHIQPMDNSSGLAGRPYDTHLVDDQYDRKEFPTTSIEEGIARCFQKFKHPTIHSHTPLNESFFYMIDLDGTLVDTDRLHYECYQKAFEQEGFCLCDYEIYEALPSFESYARETCGDRYDRMKELKNKIFYDTQEISYMPGAEPFLRWLVQTNQNVVVVTNTTKQTVDFLKGKLPLLQSISQWITRDDVANPKPHSEPYGVAKEKFYKGEQHIVGIENTMTGYFSLRDLTPLIYMVCKPQSYTHKQLQSHDVYCISSLDSILSKK
jgi:S-adenosylmethionine synthetase